MMKKDKKRKGKGRVWIVLLVIFGVIVIGMGVTMIALEPGRREALNLTIGVVDFKKLHDGTFIGDYKGTKDHLRDAEVKVTVSSGAVTDIQVIGGSLANEKQTAGIRDGKSIHDLLDQVIQSQSLQVDAISGATITSKVHLKAVETALDKAQSK